MLCYSMTLQFNNKINNDTYQQNNQLFVDNNYILHYTIKTI